VEHDYLKNGFWAMKQKDEFNAKDLYVRFLVRMDDATQRINSKLNNNMSAAERKAVIDAETKAIQSENSENGKYSVVVRDFFNGNEFYYFVYQDYKDVRLVGTPPNSLGKFGGDTDNWEWPRHTADFSMFRIYADKNGNPADYSTSNVPLNPKHYLPVNLNGVKEGDYAMILGYPGRTNRWMPAGGIEQNVKFAYPAWVEGAKTGMDNMKKYMDQSAALRLVYASKFASTANYWKNRQGMIDALSKFQTSKSKAAQEAKFNSWANKSENKAKYGNVVSTINNFYALTNEKSRHDNYLQQLMRTSAYGAIGRTLGRQLDAYAKADATKRAALAPRIIEMADGFFKDSYLAAEKDILTAQLKLYATKSVGYGIAPMVEKIGKENNYDYSKFVNAAF
jgi:hypothetical protein